MNEFHKKKRTEIQNRLEGTQHQYTELVNHRNDCNRGIEILEQEFLRIEGELRILEEVSNEEAKI